MVEQLFPLTDEPVQDIECSAVSELRPIDPTKFNEQVLFLVSQPGADTETGYISRFVTYRDLLMRLREDFHMTTCDKWLVNEAGFKRLHVVDGLISDVTNYTAETK